MANLVMQGVAFLAEKLVSWGQQNPALAEKALGILKKTTSGAINQLDQRTLVDYISADPSRLHVLVSSLDRAGASDVVSEILTDREVSAQLKPWFGDADTIGEALGYAGAAYHRKSGDGNPETVWGVPETQFQRDAASLKAAFSMVDVLVSVCGSVSMAEKFLQAVHVIEPQHFDAYRMLVQGRN